MAKIVTRENLLNDRDVVSRLKERGIYTPDFGELRLYNHIPVVIYFPELLNDRAGSDILIPTESFYLGQVWSVHSMYILKETAQDIPTDRRYVLLDCPKPEGLPSPLKGCHLKAEAFALSPRALLNLDRYVGNNEYYFRTKRSFFLQDQVSPFKSKLKSSMQFYVHIGFEEYWKTQTLNKRMVLKDHEKNKYSWIL